MSSAPFRVFELDYSGISAAWHAALGREEKVLTDVSEAALIRRTSNPRRAVYGLVQRDLPEHLQFMICVAETCGLPDTLEAVLQAMDLLPGQKPDTAIFYSISDNKQARDFFKAEKLPFATGKDLILGTAGLIQQSKPEIKIYATFSPIQGLRKWVHELPNEDYDRVADLAGLSRALLQHTIHTALTAPNYNGLRTDAEAHRALGEICRHYLTSTTIGPKGLRLIDDTADFHCHRNGAVPLRICPGADPSEQGWQWAFGFMANYGYSLNEAQRADNIRRIRGGQMPEIRIAAAAPT